MLRIYLVARYYYGHMAAIRILISIAMESRIYEFIITKI